MQSEGWPLSKVFFGVKVSWMSMENESNVGITRIPKPKRVRETWHDVIKFGGQTPFGVNAGEIFEG